MICPVGGLVAVSGQPYSAPVRTKPIYEDFVPVSSMTGFARTDGAAAGHSWSWELRSVNARGLDARLRLPSGFDGLEAKLRAAVSGRFRRGTVSINLTLARDQAATRLVVNKAVLDQVVQLADELGERLDAERPRIDGLLAIRGVLEPADDEEDEENRAVLEAALIASFDEALDRLAVSRGEEGARLGKLTGSHVEEIAALAIAARANAETQPAAIQARLREKLDALLGSEPPLSEEKLAQEVALLAVKGDIREEL
ncbi:MAG: YicC/YloC family endoribonuclease, partial [Alphaproteobacteria bacterium]